MTCESFTTSELFERVHSLRTLNCKMDKGEGDRARKREEEEDDKDDKEEQASNSSTRSQETVHETLEEIFSLLWQRIMGSDHPLVVCARCVSVACAHICVACAHRYLY